MRPDFIYHNQEVEAWRQTVHGFDAMRNTWASRWASSRSRPPPSASKNHVSTCFLPASAVEIKPPPVRFTPLGSITQDRQQRPLPSALPSRIRNTSTRGAQKRFNTELLSAPFPLPPSRGGQGRRHIGPGGETAMPSRAPTSSNSVRGVSRSETLQLREVRVPEVLQSLNRDLGGLNYPTIDLSDTVEHSSRRQCFAATGTFSDSERLVLGILQTDYDGGSTRHNLGTASRPFYPRRAHSVPL